MATQTTSSTDDASSGNSIPFGLGWIAFIFGILSAFAGVLVRLGVLPTTGYPIGGLGIALLVGGYIACFMIPPLHRRISALEQRIGEIERQSAPEEKPKVPDR